MMKKRIFTTLLAATLLLTAIPVPAADINTGNIVSDRAVSANTVSDNMLDEDESESLDEPEQISLDVETTVLGPELLPLEQVSIADASYDPRDYNLVTEVKHQTSGNCWIFATVAALESAVLKKGLATAENLDLSEMHLSYFSYPGINGIKDPLGNISEDYSTIKGEYKAANATPICAANGCGGIPEYTAVAFGNWIGPASESKFNYGPANSNEWLNGVYYPPEDAFDSLFHVQDVIYESYGPSNMEVLKDLIVKYGGFTASVCMFDGVTACIEQTDTVCSIGDKTGHSVEVVGWDDHYPKENFANSPATDGAWLAKNSYGYVTPDMVIDQSCVRDGYIWISYCDSNFVSETHEVVAFNVESKDNYDNNYQYDGVFNYSFSNGSIFEKPQNETTYMNIYEAKSGAVMERIDAVMVGTASRDVSYTVKIYTNPVIQDNKLVSYDNVSEETTGTLKESGLHTIRLQEPVFVSAGNRFAICIFMENNKLILSCKNKIVYTTGENGYNYVKTYVDNSQKGQSYIGNGTDMTQLFDLSYEPGTKEFYKEWLYTCDEYGTNTATVVYGTQETPRIKGFTKNIDNMTPATSVTINKTSLTMEKGQSDAVSAFVDSAATLQGVNYHSSNPSVATVDSNGNINAVGYGTCEIIAAAKDSGAKASCSVTVPAPTQQTVSQQNASQEPTVFTSGNFTYKLENEELTVTKCASTKYISIPSAIGYNGRFYTVTKIASGACQNDKNVTKVNIPTTVREIESNAFSGCKKLKSVKIGKGVKIIGKKAFYNCKKLSKVSILSSKLTKVGSSAFKKTAAKLVIKVPKMKIGLYTKMLKKKSVSGVVIKKA